MLRFCIVSIPAQLMLCLVSLCFAGTPQEHRATCGDYSYALPRGFTAINLPQPYADNVYLYNEHSSDFEKASHIICIQKGNVDNKEYLLEDIEVLKPMPEKGGDWLVTLKRYDGKLPLNMRAYYMVFRASKMRSVNWASFIVEMTSKDSKKNTILEFYGNIPWKKIKNKGKIVTSESVSEDELKTRAMHFLTSIRKDR